MWNSNFYFEKDGLLFCKDDYWQKFGKCCRQCNELVFGPVMIAGDHRFHPECFCCKICKNVIGDGDTFSLIDRTSLFCGSCYRRQMPSSQIQHKVETTEPLSTTVTIIKKPPHSIRLVEIPWKNENKNSIRLSIDEDPASSSNASSSSARCRGVRISE
jgi:LIM domain kinase 1